MATKAKEVDLLVLPETCTVVRFEDVEGDPDGTGPYLYPVEEVEPGVVEAALKAGASVKRGYEAPYAGDPKADIGEFCGYRRLRRAYSLSLEVAETLAKLAAQANVTGDWPLFRGVRVHEGRWVDQGEVVQVTVDYGRGPRNLARPELHADEVRHAAGFDWGYGGSGPAELARAILIALYPASAVVRTSECYQLFKRQVVARLPQKEFRLTGSEVRAWFTDWLKRQQGQPSQNG